MAAPKLFVSYSWSSPDHEQWVIDLATQLRASGVDVILDKWDLREGHDAVKFMEKMVTDPEIKKVAMIVDEMYARKADGRAGGVGTETQIISKEVYDHQEQDKFVAVVKERNHEGNPFLPTYYKSRIYIDLSVADSYGENFDKLLRWVFDRPLYDKPELGKSPSFVDAKRSVALGTTAFFRRAVDAVKNNKPSSEGALSEYFGTLSQSLEKLRIGGNHDTFDDLVIGSIESFLPYRNEAIQLFIDIGLYAPSDENIHALHRFLESLLPYMDAPDTDRPYYDWDSDNFVFIVHELFLYAVATLIKYERFAEADYLLKSSYYVPKYAVRGREVMTNFSSFRTHMKSLVHRNQRLKLSRVSVRADLLKSRCSGIAVEFKHLMQADFVLFLRSQIDVGGGSRIWWPETLLFASYSHSPFEIFARAVSKAYFDRVKCLLGIDAPGDMDEWLGRYKSGGIDLPHWEANRFDPESLLGRTKWATRP